jgi:hypothetical protein
VKTPINSCAANVVRTVCMATSSAHMMVRVSCDPAASIYMVMEVGMWTTEAPSLWCPSMSDPSAYAQFSGMYFGDHRWGTGGVPCCVGELVLVPQVKGCMAPNTGKG